MGRVTANMRVSLDGYGAGSNQSREKPFGDGTDGLHSWMFDHTDGPLFHPESPGTLDLVDMTQLDSGIVILDYAFTDGAR